MKKGMAGFRFKSRREAHSIRVVTADYVQGMLTYTRGGSPGLAGEGRPDNRATGMRVGTSTKMDCGCRMRRRAVLQ